MKKLTASDPPAGGVRQSRYKNAARNREAAEARLRCLASDPNQRAGLPSLLSSMSRRHPSRPAHPSVRALRTIASLTSGINSTIRFLAPAKSVSGGTTRAIAIFLLPPTVETVPQRDHGDNASLIGVFALFVHRLSFLSFLLSSFFSLPSAALASERRVTYSGATRPFPKNMQNRPAEGSASFLDE